MGEPQFKWMFEIVGPVLWFLLIVWFLIEAKRNGKLSIGALLLFGGTSMFWQETYADWGGYVLFNSAFVQMPWWGHTPFTSPSKPFALVASYGWFFGPVLLLFIALAEWLFKKQPSLGKFGAALITTGPLFYLWDLGIEHYSTSFGWWQYVVVNGPSLANARSAFPTVWPIVGMSFSIVVMIWVLMLRDDSGVWWHERVFGVHAAVRGVARELRRAFAWAITMNAVFFFLTTLPNILFRIFTGINTPLIP
ncbi:MAG: hypothetical protein JWM78_2615 [Verrucomicrobiaceae bacterium]|nr:hypothetical protein [Verrucomicrobiaceae bacterium]